MPSAWRPGKQAQSCPGPAETIRFRLTRRQRILPILAGGVAAVIVSQILLRTHGEPLLDTQSLRFALIAIGVPFLNLFISRDFGITLTPSEVIVHNSRRQTIKCSDIQSIRVEGRIIAIYEATGRRTRLRAPIGLLDSHFDEKFHAIETWWNRNHT